MLSDIDRPSPDHHPLLGFEPVRGVIDSKGSALLWPIVGLHGWFASRSPDAGFDLYLNDRRLDQVQWVPRPDVDDLAGPGVWSTGWQTICDFRPFAASSSPFYRLEIRSRGQVLAQEVFRYRDPHGQVDLPLNIFMHVPKTGGTSLRTALEEHQDRFFLLSLYGGGFDIINSLSDTSLQMIDLVYGHVDFGVHERISRPARYFTCLRNPYDFVASAYFFKKYVQRRPEAVACRDIFEAVEQWPDAWIDNRFTRMISGFQGEGRVDGADFDRAIANIESHFDFIGLAERSADSFKEFSRIFGLPLTYRRENVTPSTEEREMLDIRAANAAISSRVRWDMQLYKYVLKRFWNMDFDGVPIESASRGTAAMPIVLPAQAKDRADTTEKTGNQRDGAARDEAALVA